MTSNFEIICFTFQGYKMWGDELSGMDLPHTLQVVEALGKLHGLGMAFFDGPGIQV